MIEKDENSKAQASKLRFFLYAGILVGPVDGLALELERSLDTRKCPSMRHNTIES